MLAQLPCWICDGWTLSGTSPVKLSVTTRFLVRGFQIRNAYPYGMVFLSCCTSQARRLLEDCLHFYKEGGDRQITGQYLTILGDILTAQGDEDAARSLFEESKVWLVHQTPLPSLPKQ